MAVRFRRNPRHVQAIRELAGRRVVRAADAVTHRVQVLLQEPGSGVQHPGLPRRSSAPGEPPVSQSGELAASQTTRGPVFGPHEVSAASGSDLWRKAVFVQVGTARAQPRPYMLPALLQARPQVLAAFEAGGADA